VLQKYPSATPDQVKHLITTTGYPISGKSQAIGGGELQLSAALAAPLPTFTQLWGPSTGVGSLELARGLDHISIDGVVLDGERDIMGSTFDAAEMASLEAQGEVLVGRRLERQDLERDAWRGLGRPRPGAGFLERQDLVLVRLLEQLWRPRPGAPRPERRLRSGATWSGGVGPRNPGADGGR
jgi:hypothetical protein